MSLNHKRRIFRSGAVVVPRRLPGLPSPGVWLAAAGGTATLLAAAWLFVRSSDAPAHAPPSRHITASPGTLAVLDGDTLRIGDQVIRLDGIAAPPRGSVCRAGDRDVDCGAASANALAALVRDKPVDCGITGHDGYGRPVGDCMAGGVALSGAQVRDGWARAQSAALRQSEESARSSGRGLWSAQSRL
nr:thermonuclease family protein [uncultured Rhodopila sp.]